MAISIQIYDETNKTTKLISIDFFADLAAFTAGSDPNEVQYYFKITTSAKDTSNLSYTPIYIKDLSDLALNHAKRSSADSALPYDDIKTMITDYVYDMIYGHTLDQFSSGCSAKAPMKFS